MTKTTDLQPTSKLMDLVPLSRFGDCYDFPSVEALHNLHFLNTYGFADKVIRRVGKRLYVKISALEEWIEETNGGQVA